MKTFKRIKELICESESKHLIIPYGTINIERNRMPQIKLEYYSSFFKFLMLRGISVTCKYIEAKNLRAAQGEINKSKVLKWSKNMPKQALIKWPIVTADFYVLDGNHSWLALLNSKNYINNIFTSINCFQIGLNLMELLDIISAFDKIEYKTVNEAKYPFWDSFDHPFPILRNT